MTVVTDDLNKTPFVINLTGVLLSAPLPEIQVLLNGKILVSGLTNTDFGTVSLGSSKSLTLIMYNIGSTDLEISGFSFGGTDYNLFSTDFPTALPYIITAGSTKNVTITFSPVVKVNARAEISFANNDSDENPFVIKLKGRGR